MRAFFVYILPIKTEKQLKVESLTACSEGLLLSFEVSNVKIVLRNY